MGSGSPLPMAPPFLSSTANYYYCAWGFKIVDLFIHNNRLQLVRSKSCNVIFTPLFQEIFAVIPNNLMKITFFYSQFSINNILFFFAMKNICGISLKRKSSFDLLVYCLRDIYCKSIGRKLYIFSRTITRHEIGKKSKKSFIQKWLF